MELEQLQSLRDRIANATGPDREIDAAICVAFSIEGKSRTVNRRGHFVNGKPVFLRVDIEYPKLTSSIDAALALVDRVLPGWEWSVWACGGVFGATVYNTPEDEIEPSISAHAPTPALAIILAGLDALIAKEKTDDQEGGGVMTVELRKLAEICAAKGPLEENDMEFREGCGTGWVRDQRRFIAAASPSAVLALLDERDEAREAVKRLAGALEDIHVEQTDWPVKREALADLVVRRICDEG
jgi:hypothetical protein